MKFIDHKKVDKFDYSFFEDLNLVTAIKKHLVGQLKYDLNCPNVDKVLEWDQKYEKLTSFNSDKEIQEGVQKYPNISKAIFDKLGLKELIRFLDGIQCSGWKLWFDNELIVHCSSLTEGEMEELKDVL